jgi:hypothetical protein
VVKCKQQSRDEPLDDVVSDMNNRGFSVKNLLSGIYFVALYIDLLYDVIQRGGQNPASHEQRAHS